MLGVDQVFRGNTEGSFTRGGEFKSVGFKGVGDDAGWVSLLDVSHGEDLALVGDLGVLVEAFSTTDIEGGTISIVEASRE
jgi:hypothetical protein